MHDLPNHLAVASLAPGIALLFALLAFNLIGDCGGRATRFWMRGY